MKVAILAGGYGTRMSEETSLIPKPMVEIGGHPIIWHIMKTYSYWGYNDFVILTGYKSHVIKEYFINYYTRYSDITIDMSTNTVELHNIRNEPWKVTMLYTGAETMTGGRLLRAKDYLGEQRFMLTYGDGLSNVNIPQLLKSHEDSKKIVTVTAVKLAGRYGSIKIEPDNKVSSFIEKPNDDESWISGGYFIMEPEIFSYLKDDSTILERDPLEKAAKEGQLKAYKHTGFWKAMDTLKDKNDLTEMWINKKAPWAIWLNNA